jgi:uncharacterized membrane protein YphA (DoxX/SURF4 family)
MNNMEDSMAYPKGRTLLVASPSWKLAAGALAAVLLAILFVVSGVWKITDPFGWAQRITQAKVPAQFSLPAALAVGIAEVYAGVLLVVPRFRRWGAVLTGLLLLAFMGYFALFYNELRGEECSCFPWLKRVVGPGFFIGDSIMLALAVLAGLWTRRPASVRAALVVLGAVAVFAGVSYGVIAAQHTGLRAPEQVTVDGKPYPLHEGRILVYFFDPECGHCDAAARFMSKYDWDGTKVLGVPTANLQFANQFMTETGLRAPYTTDVAILRKTFKFTDAPYAVALENGRQVAALTEFDEKQPQADLRKLGFVK